MDAADLFAAVPIGHAHAGDQRSPLSETDSRHGCDCGRRVRYGMLQSPQGTVWTGTVPEGIATGAASERALFEALRSGPMTLKGLGVATGMAGHTMRRALRSLGERGVVRSKRSLLDARQTWFSLVQAPA